MLSDDGSSCIAACTGGKIVTDGDCACPLGEVEFIINGAERCGEPLPAAQGGYTAKDCEDKGWKVDIIADVAGNFAERCLIPIRIISAAEAEAARPLSETAPLQLEVNQQFDSCLLRQHAGYDGSRPSCAQVFGLGGAIPRMEDIPGGIVGVNIVAGGFAESRIVPLSAPEPTTGGIRSAELIAAVGGFGILAMTYVLSNHEVVLWNFTPQAEIRAEGGGFYAYGSKFDYSGGNWSGYWQAAQTKRGGATGDWIYGTGTSWTGDVFSASVKNTTQGLESDTEFALSAQKVFGVWTVESAYSADLEVRNLNQAWKNKLSVGASVVYDKWQVSPSAAASWKHDESIGNNTNFRLDLRREF